MAKTQKAPASEVDVSQASPADAAVQEVTLVEPAQEAPAAPTPPGNTVKARVLRDCVYGKCDDVVEIDVSHIESLHGVVDVDPAAVAYAESLGK